MFPVLIFKNSFEITVKYNIPTIFTLIVLNLINDCIASQQAIKTCIYNLSGKIYRICLNVDLEDGNKDKLDQTEIKFEVLKFK